MTVRNGVCSMCHSRSSGMQAPLGSGGSACTIPYIVLGAGRFLRMWRAFRAIVELANCTCVHNCDTVHNFAVRLLVCFENALRI